MKFILSRKGFDAEYGKIPSPILPDNRLISLPIPSDDNIRYNDLRLDNNTNYYSLVKSLSSYKRKIIIKMSDTCHLDPDIYRNVLKRNKKWLPIFGQIGAAQSHLELHNIKGGDVFLFFGWFRHTIEQNGKIIFDKNKRDDLHIIFGYFQIGRILKHVKDDYEDWMAYHPHISSQKRLEDKTNCIYIAQPHLSWNRNLPGASPFFYCIKPLILTKKKADKSYMSRSKWHFSENTFGKKVRISYHTENSYNQCYFQSAKRGQEFVLEECKEVEQWGRRIIDSSV
jgi:hypothetical protein